MRINRHGRIIPYRTKVERLIRSNSSLISELETVCQNPGLRAFESYEEMNEADAKEMAALSPKVHLQNVTALTKKLFAEELEKPMDKKIRFR